MNEATTKEAIDQAINKAKAQNIANKDLSQAKDNAKTALGQLTHLTEDNTAAFNKQLADAQSPDAVSDIIRKAQQQDATNLLNNQKQQGLADVDSLADLTDDEKDQFKQQVNDATSQAAIEKIVTDATEQGASNLLNKQKQQGTTSVNGLTNLSDDEKSDFAKRVKDATSKEAIDEAVNEATAKDLQNKAAKDLSDAKRDAQVELERLTHLTEDNRTNISQQLDSAGTPSDVANIIRDAQQQDADNLLSTQRGEGQGSIDQLHHLSNEAKAAFKDQISHAATKANIDEIVANAEQQDATNLLNSQKSNAHQTVGQLNNLTEEEQTMMNQQIDQAKTKANIDDILSQAKQRDADNLLSNQKQQGIGEIDGLSHLTQEEQDTFNQQINDAKDKKAVDDAVASAKAKDASNLLDEQKEAGTKEVNGLKDLTDTEKETFNKRVQDATTKEEIDKAIADAKAKDIENKDLSEAKAHGNSELDQLEHLSKEEKAKFKEQINQAKTSEEIADIVKAAHRQDDSNLLDNQKAAGKDNVDNLKHLTQGEKDKYKHNIDDAKTKEEIDSIINKAKDEDSKHQTEESLTKAKETGKDNVDNLKHLTQDEKDKYKHDIDNAKTKEEIDSIINKAKDEDNKHQTSNRRKPN
ncbi:hypothetical protein [Staphylococcus auricularis]|uniref:hypothetical protein n=1 Tax=Staphylococcus auricularis TaxID=29379 RepID=UPI00242B24DF|nr:hypothetical protein [Staphylococcus auricularis]